MTVLKKIIKMLLIKLSIIVMCLTIISCYPSRRIKSFPDKRTLTNYTYVKRDEWNALFPKRVVFDSHESISLIVLNDTNVSSCGSKVSCSKNVNRLQKQLLALGYNDLLYNFIIDPHGNVYEGLGWFSPVTNKIHQAYRSIGFILPDDKIPTVQQTEAAFALFREGLMLKILYKNYHFLGPEQLHIAMRKVKQTLQHEIDRVS